MLGVSCSLQICDDTNCHVYYEQSNCCWHMQKLAAWSVRRNTNKICYCFSSTNGPVSSNEAYSESNQTRFKTPIPTHCIVWAVVDKWGSPCARIWLLFLQWRWQFLQKLGKKSSDGLSSSSWPVRRGVQPEIMVCIVRSHNWILRRRQQRHT